MKIRVRVRLENHPDIAAYISTTLARQRAAAMVRNEQLVVHEVPTAQITKVDADDLVAA